MLATAETVAGADVDACELRTAVEAISGAERVPAVVLIAEDLASAHAAIRALQEAAGSPIELSVQLPSQALLDGRVEVGHLQRALDNVPAPIFSKDATGRYRACNKAFEEYIGLPRSQIIGSTVYDVAPPELAKVYEAADNELLARGRQQIYDARVKYADGEVHDVTFYKAVQHDERGEVAGLSGVMLDITERRRLETKLQQLAETDGLTALYNRRTFMERANAQIERAAAGSESLCFLVIDLDYFKQINDRFGHGAGDDALRAAADCFRSAMRADDMAARIGGDEFAVILPATPLTRAERIGKRIQRSVAEAAISSEPTLRLTVSIGIAAWQRSCTVEDTLRAADAALYQAKRAGHNRVAVAPPAPMSGSRPGRPESA